LNPTVEILKQSEDFRLLEELEFTSLVPFLMRYLKKINLPMVIFYSFHIILLAILVYHYMFQTIHEGVKWSSVLKYIGFGFFLGAVPVIPVHELIHGLACRLIGAKKIRYGVEWDSMMFYASADKFVMNRHQFTLVALLPFVLLSGLFLGLAIYGPALSSMIWLSACFFHGTMCIGDFGLLSFFSENWSHEVYTYDDLGEKKTFFYAKEQQGPNQ
jgi:hypothetical protein